MFSISRVIADPRLFLLVISYPKFLILRNTCSSPFLLREASFSGYFFFDMKFSKYSIDSPTSVKKLASFRVTLKGEEEVSQGRNDEPEAPCYAKWVIPCQLGRKKLILSPPIPDFLQI